MTGRPAAFSALALASTASVADSEMADTRAETLVGTLVGMGSIVAPGGRGPAAIYFPRRSAQGSVQPRRFDAGGYSTYTAWTGSRAVVRGSVPEYPLYKPRNAVVLEGGAAPWHCCKEQRA